MKSMVKKSVVVKKNRKGAVALAQDVLKHLKATELHNGVYCAGRLGELCEPDADASTAVKAITKHCQMCLLGALFLSKIRLFDEVPMRDIAFGGTIDVDYSNITQHLNAYFTKEEIDLMEACFEQWCGHDGVQEHYGRIQDKRARVCKVMKRVIELKGRFTLPKVPKLKTTA